MYGLVALSRTRLLDYNEIAALVENAGEKNSCFSIWKPTGAKFGVLLCEDVIIMQKSEFFGALLSTERRKLFVKKVDFINRMATAIFEAQRSISILWYMQRITPQNGNRWQSNSVRTEINIKAMIFFADT